MLYHQIVHITFQLRHSIVLMILHINVQVGTRVASSMIALYTSRKQICVNLTTVSLTTAI